MPVELPAFGSKLVPSSLFKLGYEIGLNENVPAYIPLVVLAVGPASATTTPFSGLQSA